MRISRNVSVSPNVAPHRSATRAELAASKPPEDATGDTAQFVRGFRNFVVHIESSMLLSRKEAGFRYRMVYLSHTPFTLTIYLIRGQQSSFE